MIGNRAIYIAPQGWAALSVSLPVALDWGWTQGSNKFFKRDHIQWLSRPVFLKRTKTFYPRYLYRSIGTVDVSMWTSALLDWRFVLWVGWLLTFGFGRGYLVIWYMSFDRHTSSRKNIHFIYPGSSCVNTIGSYRCELEYLSKGLFHDMLMCGCSELWLTKFFEIEGAALFVKCQSRSKVCLSLRLRGGWRTVSRHWRVLG